MITDGGSATLQEAAIGLAVALGVGLLIGVERERRKGSGVDRRPAGLRSFVVVATSGALAQALGIPGLVVAGTLVIGALALLAYGKSRSRDPGLTTELAMLATYLIGVQCVLMPALGAACGAGLAVMLAAKDRLHRFATHWLSEQELHDGLFLAALALIVLPLVPHEPIALLGGLNPRPTAALVLLIMGMQAAGHLGLRWLGPSRGVLASGFTAGFVSSTACIASFGSQARAEPALLRTLAGGAALSAAATWVQALVMCTTLAPAMGLVLAPAAVVGALTCAGAGVLMSRRGGASALPPASPLQPTASALKPRAALAVALLLGLVGIAVGYAQRHFGETGAGLGAMLAGLADAHAPIAAMASLNAAGSLPVHEAIIGVLLALSTNTLTRCGVALTTGGWAFAWRVGAALLLSLALGAGIALWSAAG